MLNIFRVCLSLVAVASIINPAIAAPAAAAADQPRDGHRRRPRFERGRRRRRRRHRPHRFAGRPADRHRPGRPLQHRAAIGRRDHADRPGRRLRRERTPSDRHAGGARDRSRAHAGGAARSSHRHPDPHRAAARRHAGQRQRPRRAEDIRQSPALVADDVLRQVPTFSLFRRTSSLSSHPTAQGVSLRGIGPSGVSRTLVLLDGVPFNDPFGGWVYWTRVPLESVERIEMVDGSSSSLYGNYAMGGVINIVTTRPARRTVELKPQYGNLRQSEVRLLRQRRRGASWASPSKAAASDTDGFPIVVRDRARADRQQRGGRTSRTSTSRSTTTRPTA